MKKIIDYLEVIGFEDANTNFLFLQYLINCKDYEPQCGLSVEQFDFIKLLVKELDIC